MLAADWSSIVRTTDSTRKLTASISSQSGRQTEADGRYGRVALFPLVCLTQYPSSHKHSTALSTAANDRTKRGNSLKTIVHDKYCTQEEDSHTNRKLRGRPNCPRSYRREEATDKPRDTQANRLENKSKWPAICSAHLILKRARVVCAAPQIDLPIS